VGDPRDWPGFHCAESLVTGAPVEGVWFDGTGYGKAVHAQLAKKEENRKLVSPNEFTHDRTFSFDALPALAHLSAESYRAEMARMVDEIVAEARVERSASGGKVLGPYAVCEQEPKSSRAVPLPGWFEDRRRMIAWDDPRDQHVKAYLARYWEHQVQYRTAAERWRTCEVDSPAPFPSICFVPGRRPRPISQMEQSAA
jgi:hypothetical protein